MSTISSVSNSPRSSFLEEEEAPPILDVEERVQSAYERGYARAERFFSWLCDRPFFQEPAIVDEFGPIQLSPEEGARFRVYVGTITLGLSYTLWDGTGLSLGLSIASLSIATGAILVGGVYMAHRTRCIESACGHLNTLPTRVSHCLQRLFAPCSSEE